MDKDVAPVFKLSDLVKLYSSCIKELGVEQHAHPHSTEHKNRILAEHSNLKAYKEGRDIFLLLTVTWGLLFIRHVMMIVIVKIFV